MGIIQNRAKNLMINGRMQFRQRSNLGVAMDTTYTYRVQDRYVTKVSNNGDFNTRIQSSTVLIDSDGFSNQAINMAANAANANAKMYLTQRIESLNAEQVAGKNASFSFEFLNRGFTDVTINLYYPDSVDNHAVNNLISSKSESFVVDGLPKIMKFEDISIPLLAVRGIMVEVEFGGIDIGVDWDNPVSKFMFNSGASVAPFEMAGYNIGEETILCQRYYEKSYNIDTPPQAANQNGFFALMTNSSAFFRKMCDFKVRKRIPPIAVVYSVNDGSVNFVNRDSTVLNGVGSYITGTRSFTFQSNTFQANVEYVGHFTADAEI